MSEPYARQRWECSVCGGEPLERDGTLICETDGLTFAIVSGSHADYISGEEGEEYDADAWDAEGMSIANGEGDSQ